jgi:hypothetical protein
VIGRAIVCGFVASVCTARALAADVCVVCTGPDATYRCTTNQASKLERLRGGDRAQHYVCITALAKAGGHTKCRVSRDASGFCAGKARSIGLAELEAALGDGRGTGAPDHSNVLDRRPARKGQRGHRRGHEKVMALHHVAFHAMLTPRRAADHHRPLPVGRAIAQCFASHSRASF